MRAIPTQLQADRCVMQGAIKRQLQIDQLKAQDLPELRASSLLRITPVGQIFLRRLCKSFKKAKGRLEIPQVMGLCRDMVRQSREHGRRRTTVPLTDLDFHQNFKTTDDIS